MDNADITAIMPEENIYKVAYPSTVKIVNGQLVYIMLDISKPVNTFLDLRQYFNGGQGDHGNVLPLMFAQNGRPLNTAGYTVKMRGEYPDGTAFELTADQSGSGNAIFNFNFLPGFFQTVGRYTFQIELDNGTNKLSSKVCFFDVEPNLLSVAMDFVDGVSPFDNEYEEWKAKVEREINQLEEEIATLMATASDCKALLNQYLKQAQEFVDAAVAKALKDVPKLDGDNTFTGTNTFNGNVRGKNITADNFSGNFAGDNLNGNALNILGSASLPTDTKFLSIDGHTITFNDLVYFDDNGAIKQNGVKFLNAAAGSNPDSTTWFWVDRLHCGPDFSLVCARYAFNINSADVGKPILQMQDKAIIAGIAQGHLRLVDDGATANIEFDAKTGIGTLTALTGKSGTVRFEGVGWF